MKAITLGKKTFNLSLMSLNSQPRERSKGTNCGNTVMWYSVSDMYLWWEIMAEKTPVQMIGNINMEIYIFTRSSYSLLVSQQIWEVVSITVLLQMWKMSFTEVNNLSKVPQVMIGRAKVRRSLTIKFTLDKKSRFCSTGIRLLCGSLSAPHTLRQHISLSSC